MCAHPTSSLWVGKGSGTSLCLSEMLTHRFNQNKVFTVCEDGEVQGFPRCGGGGGGAGGGGCVHGLHTCPWQSCAYRRGVFLALAILSVILASQQKVEFFPAAATCKHGSGKC